MIFGIVIIFGILLVDSITNDIISKVKDPVTFHFTFISSNIGENNITSTNSVSHHGNSSSIISQIINGITIWISKYGYIGIFFAALLENLFPPVPSELIFPLAGFTANIKGLGLIEGAIGMALVGAAGSTLGAIIIYFLSYKIGIPVIKRYGKYIGIREKDIHKTKQWFDKHGSKAVFFGRLAPGIREIISIPAGIEKMDFTKFIIFTFAGSLIWSIFLTLVGFYLGHAWNRFYEKYSFIFGIFALVIVVGIVVAIIIRYHKSKTN
jgi:membrane protein DedA with SNARE-associated domain